MTPRSLRVAAFALFCGLTLYAGSTDDLRRSCFERANFAKGKYWLEECIEQLFTVRPIHLAMNTIAPGTGPAVGFGLGEVWRTDRFEFLPSGTLVGTPDKSYLAQGQIVIAAPPISIGYVRGESGRPGHNHGARTFRLVSDSSRVDAKASITLRARKMEAVEQSFYGLGNFSTRAGLAPYSLRQAEVGFTVSDPIASWSSIGFAADFVQPRVGPRTGATVQIRSLYSNTGAPGLYSTDDFVRYEPFLTFRIPTRGSRYVDTKLGYEFNHDLGGSRYSFNRLSASSRTNITLRLPAHGSPRQRHKLSNFICPSLRSREHCTPGELSLSGLVNIAYTNRNSQVPFYFDETLGGTDIEGNDTLRGFVDYRFRGPSRVLFQAEYRHPLWGPLGALSFYDVGKVAILPSGLSLDHTRHDLGVGVYLTVANRVVLRIYLGFGSGEGIRPNYKLPTAY